eukprot:TRINITY_DN38859_c0_g1_i1.p1 TRINITY_DN38859_c0_g1~~TRINITY_DN38859_c0_g1_i1.p1  ORF type:complete len:112 (+),score=27.42 TRINITY_DN38859_c0_g1_i1:200-535(+)
MLGFQRTADIGEGSTLIFTNNTLDVLHTRTATSTTPVVDVFLVVKAIAFLTNISGVVSQANIDAMSVIQITLSLIHISEPTRLLSISYAVFCLKKKKKTTNAQQKKLLAMI